MIQQINLAGIEKPLKQQFLTSADKGRDDIPILQAIQRHLDGQIDEDIANEAVHHLEELPYPKNPQDGIQRLRQLLTLALVNNQSAQLHDLAKKYSRFPYWQEFQLAQALKNLNDLLMGLPVELATPKQLEGGAVPFEWGGHWSWAESPHNQFHAELGVYWYLIGELANNQDYIHAANCLAEWQQNTLDHESKPFSALFAQEQEGGDARILPFHYLLFRAAHLIGRQSHMGEIADHLAQVLVTDTHMAVLFPHLVMLEEWIYKNGALLTTIPYELPQIIHDPNTCLVGLRSNNYSVVCTHFGGRTGLGAFKDGDVEIVTYGPQHLPLGECQNFGIEGGEHAKNAYPFAEIQSENETFSIKSHARVASKVENCDSWAQYRNGTHSQTWIDLCQKFERNTLTIEGGFVGIDSIEDLSFSFYAKALECKIGESKTLKPCTLEHYIGEPACITLVGKEVTKHITIQGFSGELHVIPLAGNESFWGAQFLIAFVKPSKEKFTITITS